MTYFKRYAIIRKPTSPGHLQSNGKIKWLNHELIQHLWRISQEPGNSMDLWDLYLQHPLFAFSVHVNSRTGISSFKLQFSVELHFPSITAMTTETMAAEQTSIKENKIWDCRATVQNVLKYCAIATEKYRESLEYLIDRRDDIAFFKDPIQCGNLLMRLSWNLQYYIGWH